MSTPGGRLNRSSIFQPPASPAAFSASPSVSASTDYFSHKSRKRLRQDSIDARTTQHTPRASTPAWRQGGPPSDGIFGSAYGLGSEVVNERYRLAGGFDTPALHAAHEHDSAAMDPDTLRRRFRCDDSLDEKGHAPIFGPLARERNGTARVPLYSNPQSPSTWTGFAFGLVGKVFNFGSTVIKGFYAGGGRGYEMDGTDSGLGRSGFLARSISEQVSTPIPGAWRDDEFLGDFEQDNPIFNPSSADRPPNKRRQTDRDSWVMVGTPDVEASASAPRRKLSGGNVSRSNFAARPTASRANSRQSLKPNPRRSSSYVGVNGSPAQLPPAPFAHPTAHRASLAPTRSPQGRPSGAGSPTLLLSPEAERFAKRQAKQERQNDRAMNSMSRKMEVMIRQAQEALGTKVSIEGGAGLEDEGFVDDDW